ncbi:ribose-phosphate diphosphokinase [Mitsuokella sp. oral taxon 131]|uniref:ribose-phosphate diphosphokinase n=1 Tax=Mitsuokella sp. oral taxon 131 TaxID=1321780 RepID=UPI0003AE10A1|nr:ribose-phosphate pyrophosphokinase [Mitsuokella sp. oral taxon 131]ERL25283.1 ribose-phosphate diphosphokinase [Mitsuokella sp. oral taxon 131 str. W9106]
MPFDTGNMRILTGNANPDLARKIADHIGVSLCDAFVGHFNNGETQVMIGESIRGKDIFIIQPTSFPVNDNLMELLIMADACKRASARSITAVVPYYAYARQDRKTRGREPISAKLVANLMTTAGVTRVVTVDLHAGQIQGFFDIPVDHLAAAPVLGNYFKRQNYEDLVVVSPDLGGVTRARILADRVHAPIAIIEKRRPKPGCAEVMNLIGEVWGKTALIIDDIVDTAGSLCEGAKALKAHGAKRVLASCTHAILSAPAVERINASPIEQLVITDTIPLPPEKQSDKFVVLSLAEAIGDVIVRILSHQSVSMLFNR